jgi:alpha-tubulin suppressor-like RCC1 family protein
MRTNSWLRTVLTFVLLVGMYLPTATISQASSGSSAPLFDTTSTSTRFVDVVVGDNHTCGLLANGTVMCWGYNGEGQLGINDSFTRYSLYPVEVPNVTDAVAIAGASNITCILRRDSSMACWGYGYHGDGQGITVKWGVTTVPGMRDVVQMAVSNVGTCIINKTGYLVCWGFNYNPNSNDQPWVYTPNWEANLLTPRVIYTSDMKSVAIRNVDWNRRVCIQRYDNRLACMGYNANNQLGIGFASASNYTGFSVQGLGPNVSKYALSNSGGCAILTDSSLNCWGWFGDNYNPNPRTIDTPEQFIDVSGSTANRFYFRGVSGKVYAIGESTNGVLGVNSIINVPILTEMPELFGATRIAGTDSQHGCAVLPSGRIRCWGQNPWGQLGNGTQSGSYVPINIALPGEPVVSSITTVEDTLSDVLKIKRHPEDGIETAYMRITRVVGGRLFKADGTTAVAAGSYLPVSETERGLRFLPDANLNGIGAGAVAVQASTKANITGVSPVVVTATVTITAMADPPLMSNAETDEDTQSYDGLVITRNPVDGNEVTHVIISGYSGGQLYMPNGTTPIVAGSVIDLVTAGQGLRFTPTSNSVTTGSVSVRAATSANGDGASAAGTATITIKPVPDGAPVVTGTTTKEDELSRADIVITRNAVDGDEIRFFRVITNAPGRIYLTDGVTAVLNGGFITASAASAGLRFRPNPNIYGNFVFQAQAATSPTVEGIGGDVASAPIIITPVADTPRISTTSVDEGTQSSSGLVILPNSNDGTEVSHYRIAAIIGGTLYLRDGVTTLNVGQYITAAQGVEGLRFTPPPASMGNGQVDVQASIGANPLYTTNTRASAYVTVNDKTPPALLLPYDMILDAYYDSGSAVSFSVTASDLRDGDVTVTCDKNSGIMLPVGVHTITCTATDRSGNTASEGFTVIIQKVVPAVQLSSVDAVSGRDVPLRWSLATPINQTYKYEVQRRALPSGEWMTVVRELTARDTTIRTIGELNYAFRVRAYLNDSTVGAWSNVVNTTIDETPPQIQAWINRGVSTARSAEVTTSNRVRISMQTGGGDPAVMWRWSEDGISFSGWQSYASRSDIVLSAGDGYKEVRIEARDRVGNVTTTFTGIIVNTTIPNMYSVQINNGDEFTSINNVNLALSIPLNTVPPIAEMQFSTSGVFGSQAWEPLALGRAWTFESVDSTLYRIYVRFRNVDGAITQISQDEIMVDRTAPSAVLSVRSNTNGKVLVNVVANDRPTTSSTNGSGITAMQIATASNFAQAAWQNYSAQTTVDIGTRSVATNAIYARFKDKAGNVSQISCITSTAAKCSADQNQAVNALPEITIAQQYRIDAGAMVAIDNQVILAQDAETPLNQLMFTLQSEPVNGWLMYGGTRMTNGTRFSYADIVRKRIIYRQNGTTQEHDRIIIQASDGTDNSIPATIWFLLNGVADPEPTPSLTPSATAIPSATPSATATTTLTPSRTATLTKTATRTRTPTITQSATRTRTATRTRSATRTPSPSRTVVIKPSSTKRP